ncbi:entericidin [Rhizobium sp. P32RR-XVIII]|uniref:entericidin domain-containing protein n=1 Tax=Rhizobium sp. P32RR-XVIII TaxID=2726738 RepID=UPI001456FD69|nr:entericidin [Rhizobium sp. P32RR-XVIII]NLS06379.1 entericidin [Rhizobium sp. P32RR-XVIII]
MKTVTTIVTTCCILLSLAACGNTIRGIGRDTANTVNATQNAGNRVANAAAH